MPLYNCRSHIPHAYAITKLTEDLDPESTYVLRTDPATNELVCECPAAVRPTCRHRQMLPHFINANRINTGWVLDWDNGAQWRQYVGPLGEESEVEVPDAPEPALTSELASPAQPTDGYQPFASDSESQSPRRRGF